MRRNCRFHGEVITIKNGKYGSMYVPKEESAPKDGKKPSGYNAFDRLQEDIERIKDENIKRNRDNLDALYNIDMRNMSASMKRLFASWSDGIKKANASVETIANSQEAVVKLVAQYDENIAAIQATANSNSASISSIVKWQGETDKSIASIQQSASDNEARISLLVNSSGNGLSESAAGIIATAIAGEESLVQIIADNVELTGYVTFDNLKTEGQSVIDGNNISLVLNGEKDNGTNNFVGQSYLMYEYDDPNTTINSVMAYIRANANGVETSTTSRYALEINTKWFYNAVGEQVYPSLKLYAEGGMSAESQKAMYISSGQYMTLEADYGTRIRASYTYGNMVTRGYSASEYDYVFASDGIYYNGRLLISTQRS